MNYLLRTQNLSNKPHVNNLLCTDCFYLCLGGETCGQMNDPACGVAGVDVLTSGSARPHELELQLRLGNLELLVVRGFGQNGDTACT